VLETLKVLLYLALLCAAVYFAWKAGRRHARREALRNAEPPVNLNADYMRGLNFMLTEQPDKALDVFLQMVEVDHETVETHFALGSLYRKRGEIDRAIRIHQNLIARPNLDKPDKQNALFNLAEDYLSAGLLDRAEDLYQQIEKPGDFYDLAQKRILNLDEQQKDWEKAIVVAKNQSKDKQDSKKLAHYHCELADQALSKNDLHSANQYLKTALTYNKDFLRVKLLSARISAQQGEHKEAVKYMFAVMDQDANLVSQLLPDFFKLAEQEDDLGLFDEQLKNILQSHPEYLGVLVTALVRHDLVKTRAAKKIILAYLDKAPQFAALQNLLPIELSRNPDHIDEERFTAILDILKMAGHGKATYQCTQCGYASAHHQWLCPGCKSWDTAMAITPYQ
jgi:lipopolysaccharide biosynthesis regulator YciM